MGTNINLKNFGAEPPGDGSGLGSGSGRPPGNFGLARQPSIYSLTFDEFESTMGGTGKDFGSMNMDELLKNIWSAEETQIMGGSTSGGQEPGGIGSGGGGGSGGYLQNQGSLTLPRTLSQKTVDEVWRDISKEYGGGKDGNNGFGGQHFPQRQQTLGEMTLEEFLVRAGVARDDTQFGGRPNNNGFFGVLSHSANNTGLGIGLQQPIRNMGVMSNGIPDGKQIGIQSTNLPFNVNGVGSSQQQLKTPQPEQPQQQQQQKPLFPRQPALAYGASVPIPSNSQLGSPGIRGGIVGISDPAINGSLVQRAALQGGGMGMGMVNLGAGGVTVATGSPAVSSDGLGKSGGDVSSVSPVPFVFNGGLRGRRSSAVEKVVERRHRRMIKNRESAARSRARKQAYTTELEEEVAKLKEENQELQKKQAEIMEIQKNQVMEMMNLHPHAKRRCLRRTQTGPW